MKRITILLLLVVTTLTLSSCTMFMPEFEKAVFNFIKDYEKNNFFEAEANITFDDATIELDITTDRYENLSHTVVNVAINDDDTLTEYSYDQYIQLKELTYSTYKNILDTDTYTKEVTQNLDFYELEYTVPNFIKNIDDYTETSEDVYEATIDTRKIIDEIDTYIYIIPSSMGQTLHRGIYYTDIYVTVYLNEGAIDYMVLDLSEPVLENTIDHYELLRLSFDEEINVILTLDFTEQEETVITLPTNIAE